MASREGFDANIRDYDGRTALLLAAGQGNARLVELLIDRGALVNVDDRYGDTPLSAAKRGQHHEIARLLKERGAAVSWL